MLGEKKRPDQREIRRLNQQMGKSHLAGVCSSVGRGLLDRQARGRGDAATSRGRLMSLKTWS